MFLDLQSNIAWLHRQLQSWQRNTAKARRRENPALLFKDLKDDPAPSVETLVEGPRAIVDEVDPESGSAT